MIVGDTQNSAAVERRQVDRLITQGIDALIMAGRPRHPERVRRLSQAGLPVTDPETFAEQAGYSMTAMAAPAIEGACRHLSSLGHRRLAFITRATALRRASARRWHAIERNCQTFGIEPRHVALASHPVADGPEASVAAATLEALVVSEYPPTALWSSSHVLAPLVLEGLGIADIDIPGRCSFLTFGDSPWAAAYRPSISTISGDPGSVATAMTGALLHQLASGEAVRPPRSNPTSIGPAAVWVGPRSDPDDHQSGTGNARDLFRSPDGGMVAPGPRGGLGSTRSASEWWLPGRSHPLPWRR